MSGELGAGLHYGIPAKLYHADPCARPSLSSGLARTILAKSPLHAYLDRNKTDRAPTEAMLLGSYVHALLADEDDGFVVIQAENYKTGAAKSARDYAVAQGLQPILCKDAARGLEIAEAIRNSVAAGISNDPFVEHGRAEVTAIWDEDDVTLRARFDRLVLGNGKADLWDWKVTADVSDRAIKQRIAEHRYDIQAAFYLRGLTALRPECRGYASFVFVFVEPSHPYSVRRVCLSDEYMAIANAEVDRAIRVWRECTATGIWRGPGVGETMLVEPPAYLVKDYEENTPLIGMTKAE